MNQERWAIIRAVFETARSFIGAEREALLTRECRDDAELRREVESLLSFDTEDIGILDEPALGTDFVLSAGASAGVAGLASLASLGSSVAGGTEMPAEPPIPSTIGNYRIIGRIGQGGMGVVYEAEQAAPFRVVALKVMRPVETLTDEHHARFQREAEVLGRLQHPSIARILEAGRTEDGRPWFAMELVRGSELGHWMRSADLSLSKRLELFAIIADAVHSAHQRGVVHRDLKPSNILVDDEGVPHVLDFGLARLLDEEAAAAGPVTEAGRLVGTLAYMSPEQARGLAGAIDTRSDIYALGVILYEMLTGELPYAADPRHIPETVRAICEDAPRCPSLYDRRLRGDLDTILLTALAKEPARRYDSAAAMAGDVRRFLQHQPIVARAPSLVYTLRKLVRRFRAVSALVVVVAMLLVAAAVMSATAASRFEQEAKRNAQTAYRMRILYAQKQYEDGNLQAMTEGLAVCPENLRGWVWRWLDAKSRSDALTIRQDGVRTVAFLDGELLIIGTRRVQDDGPERHPVEIHAGLAGTRRYELAGHHAPIGGFDVSPDQRSLVTGDYDGLIIVWDLRTGAEVTRFSFDGAIGLVRFAPNGRRILAAAEVGSGAAGGADQSWLQMFELDPPAPGPVTWMQALDARFLADSKTIVVSMRGGALVEWSGDEPRTVLDRGAKARVVVPMQGGILLATTDRVVRLDRGTRRLRPFGCNSDIQALDTSRDGLMAVGADSQGQIHLWNAKTGDEQQSHLAHQDGQISVGFSPNGRWIYSILRLAEVKFWPVDDPVIAAGPGQTSALDTNRIMVDADGIAFMAQVVPLGEMVSASVAGGVSAPPQEQNAVARLIDRHHLPSGALIGLTTDGRLLSWTDSSSRPATILARIDGASALAMVGAGDQVWIGTAGGDAIEVIPDGDPGLGRRVHVQAEEVTALTVTAAGHLLSASASDGAPLRLHTMSGRSAGLPLGGHERTVQALTTDSTGQLVAAGVPGHVLIWRLDHEERTPLLTLPWPNAILRSLAFSTDGTTLRATTITGVTRIWSTESLESPEAVYRRIVGSPE